MDVTISHPLRYTQKRARFLSFMAFLSIWEKASQTSSILAARTLTRPVPGSYAGVAEDTVESRMGKSNHGQKSGPILTVQQGLLFPEIDKTTSNLSRIHNRTHDYLLPARVVGAALIGVFGLAASSSMDRPLSETNRLTIFMPTFTSSPSRIPWSIE